MQKKQLFLLLFSPCVLAEPMEKSELDLLVLGEVMFFDKTLSFHHTQSCATCHNPDTAFVDQRENSANQMVSQGDNPILFGNRNTPTALYAMFSPDFRFDQKLQDYVGGQFWDGRAKDLAEQAGGPPLNPVEMGMEDKATVVARLRANPVYFRPISEHYGTQIWHDTDKIYSLMEQAVAQFEQQSMFAPFSAKYDRVQRGEETFTELEAQGKALFFNKQRTNCSNCHQLRVQEQDKQETFTNYRYYNIGVPKNRALIAHNKLAEDFIDNGLLDNPQVKGDIRQKGKFKVPTLRNVAVTAPYMHNGVFRDLRTVLLFKDSFNNPIRKLNPETQQVWDTAEYGQTIALEQLYAKPLSDQEIHALEAFLHTLTDEAYEQE